MAQVQSGMFSQHIHNKPDVSQAEVVDHHKIVHLRKGWRLKPMLMRKRRVRLTHVGYNLCLRSEKSMPNFTNPKSIRMSEYLL